MTTATRNWLWPTFRKVSQSRVQLWLDNRWFSVVGILRSLPLARELDRAALIGFAEAHQLTGKAVAPSEIYVRSNPASTRLRLVRSGPASCSHPDG